VAVIPDNLKAIQTVFERLGPLGDRVVFLGGAAVELLIADSAGLYLRGTKDVDVIVRVDSWLEYTRDLRAELLRQGFREDTKEDAPICRWLVEGIEVDIMPTESRSLIGEANPWYPAAFEKAERRQLPTGAVIRLVTPSYFIATKLTAFRNRGKGDYRGSLDMEDVVAVIDGRAAIEAEIAASPEVCDYVAAEIALLLADEAFRESLPGHLASDEASQARLPGLVAQLERIANLRGRI
jgi:predicted nucleotidyltransferase